MVSFDVRGQPPSPPSRRPPFSHVSSLSPLYNSSPHHHHLHLTHNKPSPPPSLTQQTLTTTISPHKATTNPQFKMVAPYAAAEAVLLMQPPLPYYPNRDPEPRHPLPFFCESLKGFLLSLLFVVSLLLLVWTFSHPAFPALSVASASLSAVSITGNSVSGLCNISLVLTNPNLRLTTSYDRMEISLLYSSQQVKLSQFHHPQILQPERSQITLEANLNFSGVSLGSDVVSAMKQELDRGVLGLAIEVFAELKYLNGDQKGSPQYMRASCGGVMFGISSPGIFLNPYQECQVNVYGDIVM